MLRRDTSRHHTREHWLSPIRLHVVPIIFGAIAIMIVLGTAGIIIYKKKKKLLGRASQIEFLLLLLAGLFMSSIGGLLIG